MIIQAKHLQPEPPVTLELTLLMPCLNEAETLATCIRKAHLGAQRAGISAYEILIADNGSTDGSREIALAEGARVIAIPARGYGAALLGGIQSAQGRYILMGDADDSYDWSALTAFVERLRAGDELVMGTRIKGRILAGAMPPLHRWLGNPVLTFIGNWLFGCRVSDFHCGMRGFQADKMRSLELRTNGMEFASEMVIRASLSQFTISEVPIVYYPDGRSRPPHLRTWRDGWRHLSFMLLMSPLWLFVVPGITLMAFGLLANLLILPGTFFIGRIALDVHTLLVGNVALMVGVQLLAFGILGRTFAYQQHLLPQPPRLLAFMNAFSLNNGLLLGALIVLVGLIPMAHSVQLWLNVSFGSLNYQVVLRWLIPGLTLCVIGIQIIFSSFMLALLTFYKR